MGSFFLNVLGFGSPSVGHSLLWSSSSFCTMAAQPPLVCQNLAGPNVDSASCPYFNTSCFTPTPSRLTSRVCSETVAVICRTNEFLSAPRGMST